MESILVLPPSMSLTLPDSQWQLQEGLEEVYLGDLLPAMRNLDRDHIHSEWGYWDYQHKTSEAKNLPYHDAPSLEKVQQVGYRLWRDTNVQNAIQSLISYVVYKGWWYSLSRSETAQGNEYKEDKLQLLKRTHKDMLAEVSLGTLKGWLFVQEESYRRFLRDGEFFRRWWIVDGVLQVRFIEVVDISQPPSRREVLNLSDVPAVAFTDDLEKDEAPGELGIVSMPDDAATELGYWQLQRGPEQKWKFLSATRCQHAK